MYFEEIVIRGKFGGEEVGSGGHVCDGDEHFSTGNHVRVFRQSFLQVRLQLGHHVKVFIQRPSFQSVDVFTGVNQETFCILKQVRG